MASPIGTFNTGRKKTNDEIAEETKARRQRMKATAKDVYESMKGKKLSGVDRTRNPDGASPRLPTPRPFEPKKSSTKPKPINKAKIGPKVVYAAPKPRSKSEGDEMRSTAWEKRVGSSNQSDKKFPAGGPDNSRTSGDRDSRGGLGYRIGKALGDKRREAQMVADRKATEAMERERGK